MGKPETVNAASKAEGPGMEKMETPSSIAEFTK